MVKSFARGRGNANDKRGGFCRSARRVFGGGEGRWNTLEHFGTLFSLLLVSANLIADRIFFDGKRLRRSE
jgi:hypothetical protein